MRGSRLFTVFVAEQTRTFKAKGSVSWKIKRKENMPLNVGRLPIVIQRQVLVPDESQVPGGCWLEAWAGFHSAC